MKTPLALSLLGGILVASLAFGMYRMQVRDQQQNADHQLMVEQLLEAVERGTARRLDDERLIGELRSTISELRSQVASSASQLEFAQQQVNPEYEVMERQIRREVTRELQSRPIPRAALSKSDLVRQLNDLDPAEVGEIMTLQSQYGGFLQSLDVSDARMDVIVDGLSNLVAEQNQARMEMMQQLRQQDVAPQDLRLKMQSINSPEAQREALSFVLTDDEMALFNETLASQPTTQNIRMLSTGATGAVGAPGQQSLDSTVFFSSGQIGTDGPTRIEIIRAEPQ